LTSDNYDKLKSEFLVTCTKTPVDEKVLTDIIDQIYIFAIHSHNISALYSKLCAALWTELYKNCEENAKQFKRLLLNRFEKNTATLDHKSEEIEKNMLRKKVGNMTFIGELHLQDMLSERIMHEIIKHLLVVPTPIPSSDDIQVLCKLLTIIGEKMDHEESKKYVNFYFKKMESLSQYTNLDLTLRSMLRDVIDMRNNNWVATTEITAAKTRQEAKDETIEQCTISSSLLPVLTATPIISTQEYEPIRELHENTLDENREDRSKTDNFEEHQNEVQLHEEERSEGTIIYYSDHFFAFNECAEPSATLNNNDTFQSVNNKPTMGTAGFGRTGGIPFGRGRGTGGVPFGRGCGRGRGGYGGPIFHGGGRGRGTGRGGYGGRGRGGYGGGRGSGGFSSGGRGSGGYDRLVNF